MDKYEYKVRSEEIKKLIQKKKYSEAMKIADTIDWRRVKSVNMLCTISDLYKMNRHYEESREILLLAYDKNPIGRTIVYSLCELSIKLNDIVMATEYYKEFMKIAPQDNGGFILLYKIYEVTETPLEERIAVLEDLKAREYREKWAYELAYLYHRVGLSTRCVEECDELILWFGEGRYVTKAMELKMLHAPLTAEQQKKYNKLKGIKTEEPVKIPSDESAEEMDIQVKPVNVGEYATINLQRELAESMKEVLQESNLFQKEEEAEEEDSSNFTKEILTNLMQNTDEMTEISVSSDQIDEEEIIPENENSVEKSEVIFEEEPEEEKATVAEVYFEDPNTGELPPRAAVLEDNTSRVVKISHTGEIPKIIQKDNYHPEIVMPSAQTMAQEKHEEFDKMLSQEYNGQISLAIDQEADRIEKQITGQMSIDDILQEWERRKKENEQQRAEAVRKKVKEQTGELFAKFDESTKQGVLAELDALAEESMEKERRGGLTYDEKKKLNSVVADMEELPEVEELEEIEEIQDTSSIQNSIPKIEEKLKETAELEEKAEANNQIEEKVSEESNNIEEAVEEKAESKEDIAAEETDNKKDEVKEEDTKEAANQAKSTKEKAKKAKTPEETEEKTEKVRRQMTPEERKLFGQFIQTKSTRDQIIDALDNISLAAYTGNVILTGEPGMDTIELAKNIIKDIKMSDSNFSGKMAKVTGHALNNKDPEKVFEKLENGALIIEGAGNMKKATIAKILKLLEQEKMGIIVILEDTKITMNKLLDNHNQLLQNFNLRIDVDALDNDSLVLYAKRYAMEKEYSIDALAVLALHSKISELQTSEHSVTTREMKEIMDEAIEHANKKSMSHFVDILFGKRYDNEDMIIIRERDFV